MEMSKSGYRESQAGTIFDEATTIVMDRRRRDGARVGGRESTGTGRGMVSRRYDKAVALTSRANTPLSVLPGFVSSDVTFHACRYSRPRGRFTDKRITR